MTYGIISSNKPHSDFQIKHHDYSKLKDQNIIQVFIPVNMDISDEIGNSPTEYDIPKRGGGCEYVHLDIKFGQYALMDNCVQHGGTDHINADPLGRPRLLMYMSYSDKESLGETTHAINWPLSPKLKLTAK